ncbi:MAG: DUF1573 domain-containing protein [Planctomycetes bacterium]|nr:DUF1573 domain-containing protein [Planctomycetota bacterium]
MRAHPLFALLLVSALFPGCGNRTADNQTSAEPAAGYHAANHSAASTASTVYPLSIGGSAESAGGPAGHMPAPGRSESSIGDGSQPVFFVSQPYVMDERPAAGTTSLPQSGGTRFPSPYDALLQGRYSSGFHAGQPYITTVPIVPAQPDAAHPPPQFITQPTYPDALGIVSYTETEILPGPTPGYSTAVVTETAITHEVQGLQLAPAADIPPGRHPEDAATSQWFEILRPGNVPLRIGRVSATCVCVSVRIPKRQIEAGERALVEVRTLTRPPRNNLTYGIFVNILEPQAIMLDADVTIRY